MKQSLDILPRQSQYKQLSSLRTNLQRNFSLKQKGMIAEPKSPRKMLNKNKKNQNSYIAKALSNIQNGCIDEKTGHLKIDGQFGDYRMKIFRNKDKLKHYNDPSSIFHDKQFLQKIWDYADCGVKINQQQSKQLNLLYQEPLSPKKGARHQRARIGLKRNNSILSPGLKQMQVQKSQKINLNSRQQIFQLTNKVNDILTKPMDYYLYKGIQNEEDQQEKNKLRKGIEQQLRQKQGYLFYRSIPTYMAQKWFKTIDNSTADGNFVAPFIEQPIVIAKAKKRGPIKTHLFRFLQKNCQFNDNRQNKSMIAI